LLHELKPEGEGGLPHGCVTRSGDAAEVFVPAERPPGHPDSDADHERLRAEQHQNIDHRHD
jgi:hypothetical protein